MKHPSSEERQSNEKVAEIGATLSQMDSHGHSSDITDESTASSSENMEPREDEEQAPVRPGNFAEATHNLLMADSWGERAKAARILGELGNSSAVAYLVAALHDTSPEVRLAAIQSLGKIGDIGAIEPLNELLVRERNRGLPGSAISDAIDQIKTREGGTPEVTPAVEIPQVARTENPIVNLYAEEQEAQESNGSNQEFEHPAFAELEALRSEQAAKLERIKRAEADRHKGEGDRREIEQKVIQPEDVTSEVEAISSPEKENRLAGLESIRQRAEAETYARLSKEQQLKGEIEALRKTEAEQLKRIEAAKAARQAHEGAGKQLEEESRRRAELAHQRLAGMEATHNKARLEAQQRAIREEQLKEKIEALAQAEARELKRIEEVEARLAELEESRYFAETKARQRTEREQRVSSEIEVLTTSQAEQLERIREAEARLREARAEIQRQEEEEKRLREQATAESQRLAAQLESYRREQEEARLQAEAEIRRQAEEEEQHLAMLEALRSQTEAGVRQRAQQVQALKAEIEALRQSEAEQVKSLEEAKARLAEQEEICHQAELKTRQRSEREERLTAEREALHEVEIEQSRRIEQLETEIREAQAEALRKSEEETRLRTEAEERNTVEAEARAQAAEEARLQLEAQNRARAEDEEQRLAELDAIRAQAEAETQQRAEREQRLRSAIEVLRQKEAAQVKLLEEAALASSRRSRYVNRPKWSLARGQKENKASAPNWKRLIAMRLSRFFG